MQIRTVLSAVSIVAPILFGAVALPAVARADTGDAPSNPKDHTLEVLAIVHQLVDLNKSANDLRLTPSVQVLP